MGYFDTLPAGPLQAAGNTQPETPDFMKPPPSPSITGMAAQGLNTETKPLAADYQQEQRDRQQQIAGQRYQNQVQRQADTQQWRQDQADRAAAKAAASAQTSHDTAVAKFQNTNLPPVLPPASRAKLENQATQKDAAMRANAAAALAASTQSHPQFNETEGGVFGMFGTPTAAAQALQAKAQRLSDPAQVTADDLDEYRQQAPDQFKDLDHTQQRLKDDDNARQLHQDAAANLAHTQAIAHGATPEELDAVTAQRVAIPYQDNSDAAQLAVHKAALERQGQDLQASAAQVQTLQAKLQKGGSAQEMIDTQNQLRGLIDDHNQRYASYQSAQSDMAQRSAALATRQQAQTERAAVPTSTMPTPALPPIPPQVAMAHAVKNADGSYSTSQTPNLDAITKGGAKAFWQDPANPVAPADADRSQAIAQTNGDMVGIRDRATAMAKSYQDIHSSIEQRLSTGDLTPEDANTEEQRAQTAYMAAHQSHVEDLNQKLGSALSQFQAGKIDSQTLNDLFQTAGASKTGVQAFRDIQAQAEAAQAAQRAEMAAHTSAGGAMGRAALANAGEGVLGAGGAWGGAEGGAALGTMIAPGPGTIIGGLIGAIAGGFTGGYIGKKGQEMAQGPEATAQREKQSAIDAAIHPIAAGMGGLLPTLPAMLVNPEFLAQKGVSKFVTPLMKFAAADAEPATGAGWKLLNSAIQGGVFGSIQSGGGLATGEIGPGQVPWDILRSAVTMAPLGLIPGADATLRKFMGKSPGQVATIVGDVLGKAPADAATMAVSDALYDHFTGKKEFDPSALTGTTLQNLPGFMALNLLGGLLHARAVGRVNTAMEGVDQHLAAADAASKDHLAAFTDPTRHQEVADRLNQRMAELTGMMKGNDPNFAVDPKQGPITADEVRQSQEMTGPVAQSDSVRAADKAQDTLLQRSEQEKDAGNYDQAMASRQMALQHGRARSDFADQEALRGIGATREINRIRTEGQTGALADPVMAAMAGDSLHKADKFSALVKVARGQDALLTTDEKKAITDAASTTAPAVVPHEGTGQSIITDHARDELQKEAPLAATYVRQSETERRKQLNTLSQQQAEAAATAQASASTTPAGGASRKAGGTPAASGAPDAQGVAKAPPAEAAPVPPKESSNQVVSRLISTRARTKGVEGASMEEIANLRTGDPDHNAKAVKKNAALQELVDTLNQEKRVADWKAAHPEQAVPAEKAPEVTGKASTMGKVPDTQAETQKASTVGDHGKGESFDADQWRRNAPAEVAKTTKIPDGIAPHAKAILDMVHEGLKQYGKAFTGGAEFTRDSLGGDGFGYKDGKMFVNMREVLQATKNNFRDGHLDAMRESIVERGVRHEYIHAEAVRLIPAGEATKGWELLGQTEEGRALQKEVEDLYGGAHRLDTAKDGKLGEAPTLPAFNGYHELVRAMIESSEFAGRVSETLGLNPEANSSLYQMLVKHLKAIAASILEHAQMLTGEAKDKLLSDHAKVAEAVRKFLGKEAPSETENVPRGTIPPEPGSVEDQIAAVMADKSITTEQGAAKIRSIVLAGHANDMEQAGLKHNVEHLRETADELAKSHAETVGNSEIPPVEAPPEANSQEVQGKSAESDAEAIRSVGRKVAEAHESNKAARVADKTFQFEWQPADDPQFDGDGWYDSQWKATTQADEYLEKFVPHDSIHPTQYGKFYVGEGITAYPSLDAAKQAVKTKVAEYLENNHGQFGNDLDGQASARRVFSETAPLFRKYAREGWVGSKWGSWYLAAKDAEGEPLKLSIRDHEASRKDLGLPDKAWEVSKLWEPAEVAEALVKAHQWLGKHAEADAEPTVPSIEAAASEQRSAETEGAATPQEATKPNPLELQGAQLDFNEARKAHEKGQISDAAFEQAQKLFAEEKQKHQTQPVAEAPPEPTEPTVREADAPLVGEVIPPQPEAKPAPLNMAGESRPARKPKAAIPEFSALHVNAQAKFNEAWEAKDAEAMKNLLDRTNKDLRGEFESRSGVKLPSTAKGMREAVDAFFAKPAEEAPTPAEAVKDTPATAEAKVEEHVQEVASTEGQRDAAEVKAELIDRLTQVIASVEAAETPASTNIRSALADAIKKGKKGKVEALRDMLAKEIGERSNITINIPGDGDFTITNDLEPLREMLKRVKSLDTKATPAKRPEKVNLGSTGSDARTVAKGIYTAEDAKRWAIQAVNEDPHAMKVMEALRKDMPSRIAAHSFSVDAVEKAVKDSLEPEPLHAARSPIDADRDRLVEPGFYSKLDATIAEKMPNKAPAALVKALVSKPESGIKAEELKWSGLLPWLDSQTGPVTKEAVRQYLVDEGRVHFKEVVHQSAPTWTVKDSQSHETFKSQEEAEKERKRWITANMNDSEWESPDATGWVIEGDEEGGYRVEDARGRYIDDFTSEDRAQTFIDEAIEERDNEESQKREEWEKEVQIINEGNTGDTGYSDYTLPGGENYREVVLTMPKQGKVVYTRDNVTPLPAEDHQAHDNDRFWYFRSPDNVFQILKKNTTQEQALEHILRNKQPEAPANQNFISSHFSDAGNYVAHMRLNDRTDAEGRPGTFIEEIQSDRHQQAREKGYRQDKESSFADLIKQRDELSPGQDREAVQSKINNLGSSDPGIPDAPFRSTWPLQMVKRALRDAVAADHKWIGWTTGETQADRFSLAKQADSIHAEKRKTTYALQITDKKGDTTSQMVPHDKLADFVGKELANKIVSEAEENPDGKEYSGLDLKVGGDGMKGFYDQILPKEVAKYVKQWGGTVERATQQVYHRLSTQEIAGHAGISTAEFHGLPEKEQIKLSRAASGEGSHIWRMNIPPEMAKAVREQGQPLFTSQHPTEDDPYDFSDPAWAGEMTEEQLQALDTMAGKPYEIPALPHPEGDIDQQVSNTIVKDRVRDLKEYTPEEQKEHLEYARKFFNEHGLAKSENQVWKAYGGEGPVYAGDVRLAQKVREVLISNALTTTDPVERQRKTANAQAIMDLYNQQGRAAGRMVQAYRLVFDTPEDAHRETLSQLLFNPPASAAVRNAQSREAKMSRVKALEAEVKELREKFKDAGSLDRLEQGRKIKELEAQLAAEQKAPDQESVRAEETEERRGVIGKAWNAIGVSLRDLFTPKKTVADAQRSPLVGKIMDELAKTADAKGRPIGPMGAKVMGMIFDNKSDKQISRATGIGPETVRDIEAKFDAIAEPWFKKADAAGMTPDKYNIDPTGDPFGGLERKPDSLGASPTPLLKGHPNPPAAPSEWGTILKNPPAVRNAPSKMKEPFDLNNPRHAILLVQHARRADATVGDMAYEYYMASIFSGPHTLFAKAGSDIYNFIHEYGILRPVEAMMNHLFTRDFGDVDPTTGRATRAGGATFGEYRSLAKSASRNFIEAFRHAWQSASDGARLIESQRLGTGMLVDEHLNGMGFVRDQAIPGKIGDLVRFPGKGIDFVDAFARHLIGGFEVEAQAHRIASAEGLKPGTQAFDDRVTEQRNTPGSMAWVAAVHKGQELTSTEELPEMLKRAQKFMHERDPNASLGTKMMRWALKFLFPVVKTPYNFLRRGLVHGTPLGTLNMAGRLIKGWRGNQPMFESYPKAEIARHLAEQALAYGMTYMLMAAVEGDDNDDKKPLLITGSRTKTESAGQSQHMMRTRGGESSIVVNGKPVFNYSRMEPIATALDTVVNMVREWKQTKRGVPVGQAVAHMVNDMMDQVREKSFMQGLDGFMKLTDGGVENAGHAMVQNILGAVVPKIITQPLKDADPLIRDRKSAPWYYNAFPMGGLAEPLYDLYGRQQVKGGSFPSRLMNPSVVEPGAPMNADKALEKFNVQHPMHGEGPGFTYYPTAPGSSDTRYKDAAGKWQTMTAAEAAAFRQRAGKKMAEGVAGLPPVGTQENVDAIRKVRGTITTPTKKDLFPAGRSVVPVKRPPSFADLMGG